MPPGPLPTTAALVVRLAASAVGLFGAAWVATLGLSFVLFPGGPKTRDELLAAVAVLAPASLVVLAIAASRELRWLPHLRASLVARRENASSPPPATRPLLSVFGAPFRVMMTTLLGVMVLLLIDAVGLLSETRSASLRLPFDLLALGFFQLAIHGAVLIWRGQLWPWLGTLAPADLHVPMVGSMATRVALRYISTVGFVGAALMAVLLAHVMPAAQSAAPGASDEASLLVGAAILVVGVQMIAVWAFGLRLGRLAAGDARRVKKEVDALAAEEWPMKRAPADPEHLATHHARDLRQRIHRLAARFSARAGAEAEGRAASEETQRLKTRFMAYMSHDLRSPLNSIKGFTEVLARGADGPLNRDQLESVEAIQEGGDDLLRLVTDIVDSARLDAGRLELHKQWTPMVTIVAEVVGRARLLVRGRPLELESLLEPGLPAVHVDRERLAQAISNVLAHTLRLIDRGTLTVAVRSTRGPPGPRNQVRIDLVASEPLPTREEGPIFRAFEGVKAKSGRRVGGLGLGLSLARALLVLHDGDLWYEGRSEARGARFCFAVPVQHNMGD